MLMGILMQCPSLRADVQLADCSASLFFDSFAARILQVEDEQGSFNCSVWSFGSKICFSNLSVAARFWCAFDAMTVPDDARERATQGRMGQFKATHSRADEAARLHAALTMQQSDNRAERLEHMRRVAMEALLGSKSQNDLEEEVEIPDDEDEDVDASGDMDMDGGYKHGKSKMQRLRRLHRTLFFARQLQVPDWMLVPPDDLAASWLVLAKPEGERCLLLSEGGRVEVRKKNGYVLERYTDSRLGRGLTILDVVCIEGPAQRQPICGTAATQEGSLLKQTISIQQTASIEEAPAEDMGEDEEGVESDEEMGGQGGKKGKGKGRRRRPQGNRKYAVCDVLVWGDVDLAGTEAECRLFWLESRFQEMREKAPRRARPLQLVRAMPATAESLKELYYGDFGYPKDSLLFLHREGRYQVSEPVTPVARLWRDAHVSRYVVDTPDEKGAELPPKQSVVLEIRGGGRLRTADRHLVAQCNEDELAKLQGGQIKPKALVRCDVRSIDIVNRQMQVVPVAHVAARSRVWADSWARIVFQHLHREGQGSMLSFDLLLQSARWLMSRGPQLRFAKVACHKATLIAGSEAVAQVAGKEGKYERFLDAKSVSCASFENKTIKVQLTAHEVVQALTKGGWTEWSTPGSIQMPRIGYEQEQLVSERRANALYRADLLPQALYKEYERCWDSVDESLTADRLDRIHQVLHGKKELAEEFDHELSRWLVDMEGPIRESSRMLEVGRLPTISLFLCIQREATKST
ncbi:Snurportin-1 (RNA U transporter 1) [Durusdinium trenchii]|uniref:Snurportin-1 n=1 Tax=Durusdinium trenchii TaxID=1381693 RepID=A0ABP0M1D4_9DINO